MANPFEPKKTSVPLQPKTTPPEPTTQPPGGLQLPSPSPKRKQYSVYVSEDMMERVRQIARQRGVTIGAVIEACVKTVLEQMGE